MTETRMITQLQDLPADIPLIDVRTPAEFEHGHIPGAFNLPLFTNEERVVVGTTYKQQGKDAAVLLGFDLTGSKWSGFIKHALEIAPAKKIAVHCWRGGMRSSAMAWALGFYGFRVSVIHGGYKTYRHAVHAVFAHRLDLRVIGGMTGSDKTGVLHALAGMGEQVIDLEDLAGHQGSTYGSLNRLKQPTQEQFENNFAAVISKLDPARPVWVEDEAINIGRCQVPKPFWLQMQDAILLDLQVPENDRVELLTKTYGSLDKTFLTEATSRIRKRLGPEQTKFALTAIDENRPEDFVKQVLIYYDKTYAATVSKRSPARVLTVKSLTINNTENAIAVKRICNHSYQIANNE
ncbi:MAG: tRNA 2-selenouridine(34) synthase MnmH [Sphingobacteriales bacterium]|nr:MAG: tRNA 2-selenouridine(34) synthase MnmH [Sphingobacteriales bacterium]